MPDNYFGYSVRSELFPTEDTYFKANPQVTGMAAEDGSIIFNPYSSAKVNKDAVGQNEATRLWLRENKIEPKFDVTPEQIASFKGTPYENDPLALKHTILGRIISGDPSAGKITPIQEQWAMWVRNHLNKRRY